MSDSENRVQALLDDFLSASGLDFSALSARRQERLRDTAAAIVSQQEKRQRLSEEIRSTDINISQIAAILGVPRSSVYANKQVLKMIEMYSSGSDEAVSCGSYVRKLKDKIQDQEEILKKISRRDCLEQAYRLENEKLAAALAEKDKRIAELEKRLQRKERE